MAEIAVTCKLHDQINFYWNGYALAMIANLGRLFSTRDNWPKLQRIGFLVSVLFLSGYPLHSTATGKTFSHREVQRKTEVNSCNI